MFKDIYKQANDKIDTDAPKSRVMAKLSTSPAPVVHKRHSVAKAAALAACFVLTIAAAGIYENMQKGIEMPPAVTETAQDLSEIPARAYVTEKEAEAPTAKKAIEAPTATRAAEPADKAAQASPGNDTNVQTEAINDETAVEFAAKISDDSAEEESEKDNLAEEKMYAGDGVAVARFALTYGEEKAVSVEEYCEYLGKNIPEVVAVPDGVVDKTAPVQNLPADEDRYTFLFTGEEKTIQIETTKNTDMVQAMIDNPAYEKTNVGGSPSVVLEENGILKAYLASDGIGYTVTAVNCTESEIEDLLVSLN